MKAAAKPRIGGDPFDQLVSPQRPRPSVKASRSSTKAESATPARPSRKVRATIHLPADLFDHVRDAVVACSGPPLRLTLAGFAEQALRNELERLEKKQNEGKRFPRRAGELRGGRPLSA
jgi:hypothetical protein